MYRKWFGIVWLMLELNLLSGNIFGFPAIFKVLAKYGIYDSYCQSTISASNITERDCSGQTKQYQVSLLSSIVKSFAFLRTNFCLECINLRYYLF